ncbi:serine protease protn [Drechmeria coniospora]|uniref:Serine protease protn n=1 Tax=Drechmeria coniospora TaxID=98403 RepID=A0A151GK64_DRECN|nr:serine protease protn [Drechmeria coniospora]KYK57494.1 serine protease protn [Drechmeria coniospora]ODA79401.1 hypothetical protein RJ55_04994 [Drechmeria coniospora]
MVNLKNIAVAATTLLAYAGAAPFVSETGEFKTSAKTSKVIPGKYIITLKDGLQARDLDSHLDWVNGVHKRGLSASQFKGVERTYNGKHINFRGYAGHFDQATVAEIRKNPDVALVEADQVWELAFIDPAEEVVGIQQKRDLTTQTGAPWGLGTVSHRSKGSTDYVYDTNAGAGTFAYVVDTGIVTTHEEFEGRAEAAFTAFPNDANVDTFGHGTHVAGTIAGKTFGVAKKAKIQAVKVFQGSSSATSIILAGYNWAVEDIIAKGRTGSAAINLSLGGPKSVSFNNVVDAASKKGVLSIIAAGNESQDASRVSPASAESAVTVGALTKDWTMSYFSNWGTVLDIFAPGSDVNSAWIGSNSATKSISGTSMATPHVVGLALTAMSVDGVQGVDAVTKHLTGHGTKDKITGNIRGSPNVIGNNNRAGQ